MGRWLCVGVSSKRDLPSSHFHPISTIASHSAYYPDARDYDDCLAAFYDWQDLTDQVKENT